MKNFYYYYYYYTLTIFILFVIIAIILFNYQKINDFVYQMKLKYDFDTLKQLDLPWKIINFNIDGFIGEDRKIIFNIDKLKERETIFKNENAVGAIINNMIVLDIDDAKLMNTSLFRNLPKNTVVSKTNRGFHYFFKNDTGDKLLNYTHLFHDGKKYKVDLFTHNQLLILPPTSVENHTYTWINSPFHYKMLPISNFIWILNLFKNTYPYQINNSLTNFCVNNFSINETIILCWDPYSQKAIITLCQNSNVIKIGNFDIGYLFKFNTNFFLLVKKHPFFQKISVLVNSISSIIEKYRIKSLVNLSSLGSNIYNIGDIFQVNNAFIKNPERFELNFNKITGNKLLLDTTKYSDSPVYITNNYHIHNKFVSENYHLFGEDVFVGLIIANKLNISSLCLVCVTDNNDKKEYYKYALPCNLKMLRYLFQN
jgi:hypothetical protein